MSLRQITVFVVADRVLGAIMRWDDLYENAQVSFSTKMLFLENPGCLEFTYSSKSPVVLRVTFDLFNKMMKCKIINLDA